MQPPKPPAGLKAMIDKLRTAYPDQPNPLQVTTVLKFWLGGHDPLDYISMFSHRGDYSKNIPPHWHYVSFGLSDLHGDGRVHAINSDEGEQSSRSGMGFELTFRLQKTREEERAEKENPNEKLKPPTWPASLMQNLARYCFRTGNRLCFGDNIPWRKGLDDRFDTPLQNILIAEDPQLGSFRTPFGTVDFCQVVGVTYEELEQATRWNGQGILNYMRHDIQTGGEWLVTNIDRTLSVFDIFPEYLVDLQEILNKDGSDLAGINAEFTFREISKPKVRKQKATVYDEGAAAIVAESEVEEGAMALAPATDEYEEEGATALVTAPDVEEARSLLDSMTLTSRLKIDDNQSKIQGDVEEKKLKTSGSLSFPTSMSISGSSLHDSCPIDDQPIVQDSVTLDGIEITIAPYAAKYLLLAVQDRVRHGRHFTFKAQHLALTFVAESVAGAGVSKASPYGVLGYWIQVLIPDDLVPRMIRDFQVANMDRVTQLGQRVEFEWPDKNLKIIVAPPLAYMLPPMGY